MLNQNAPRTSRAQEGRTFPKRHERILRERLGLVEQVSRPLRLLPGLVLLLSPAALVGGLSTSAEANWCYTSTVTSDTVTNNGCIATSGTTEFGILSLGPNATITNSGTITTTGLAGFGVFSIGSNLVVTNSGTITTSSIDGLGIYSEVTMPPSPTPAPSRPPATADAGSRPPAPI